MWTPDFIPKMATEILILAGAPALVMWIVGRFIGRRPAMVIGFLAIAAVVFLIRYMYLILDTHRICTAPPNFLIFGAVYCDTPGTIEAYLFVWIAGPIAAALILATTFLQYRQFRWQKQF